MNFVLVLPFLCGSGAVPINDPSQVELKNASAAVTAHKGGSALKLVGASADDGLAFIRSRTFHNGTIEVDLAGAPAASAGEQARGFVGIAFRAQKDQSRFEKFYIRPTNGRADDQLRRNHSVQYTSEPVWPWERLRKESPGVYESYADMAAGEWTHLRIVVQGTEAKLYVGASAAQPCLIVHDLKLGDTEGAVALWIGPGTEGHFANLKIAGEEDKGPRYGSEDSAGHYVPTPDARIYYERYGDAGDRPPLVLLHGGEYGYIDEFGELITEMSKRRTVIAIATRGYGRSERGTVPLSHRQFAVDAAAVIEAVFPKGEKADLLGFSEGAITAYILASSHPERFNRVVAIGGSLGRKGQTDEANHAPPLTPELMQKQVPDLVAARKKVMAHPEQWEPLIRELDRMYQAPVFVREEEIRAIPVPTLIMAGDRDDYTRPDHFVDIFHLLPKGQLTFIPGCGHVVLGCKAGMVFSAVHSFLDEPLKP